MTSWFFRHFQVGKCFPHSLAIEHILENSPNASRACEKALPRTLPSAVAAPATALLVQAPQGRKKSSPVPSLQTLLPATSTTTLHPKHIPSHCYYYEIPSAPRSYYQKVLIRALVVFCSRYVITQHDTMVSHKQTDKSTCRC